MTYFFVVIFELIVLSLLSKKVYSRLSLFLLRIVKKKQIAVWLMAVLYFPGTLVHELSHFFAAVLLNVPVGDVNLIPRIEDGRIKYGSVAVAKKGPIRMFIISVAPLIVGTLIIFILTYLYFIEQLFTGFLPAAATSYFVITIANSMFLSKADFKGVWALLVSLVVIFVIVYPLLYFALDINLSVLISDEMIGFIQLSNIFLAIPILMNILTLLAFSIRK